MKNLPGGRGRQRGPDARASEGEFFEERAGRLNDTGGWYISTGTLPFSGNLGITWIVNQARFGMCLPIYEEAELVECRIRISGIPVASSTYHASLYRYVSTPQPHLLEMPNARVHFDSSTTGTKTATLVAPLRVKPGVQYFAGGYSASAVTAGGVASSTAAGILMLPSQTGLPTKVNVTSGSKSLTLVGPLVTYFSREAIKVL